MKKTLKKKKNYHKQKEIVNYEKLRKRKIKENHY